MHQSPKGATKVIADKCSRALRHCMGRALEPCRVFGSLSQRKVHRGSYCAEEGAQEGFPTNLIIQATTQLQKHTPFACCFTKSARPSPFQRSIQGWPPQHQQRDSMRKARSPEHPRLPSAWEGSPREDQCLKPPAAPGRWMLNRCVL